MFSEDKRSSLFAWIVSDEEKKFYDIVSRTCENRCSEHARYVQKLDHFRATVKIYHNYETF